MAAEDRAHSTCEVILLLHQLCLECISGYVYSKEETQDTDSGDDDVPALAENDDLPALVDFHAYRLSFKIQVIPERSHVLLTHDANTFEYKIPRNYKDGYESAIGYLLKDIRRVHEGSVASIFNGGLTPGDVGYATYESLQAEDWHLPRGEYNKHTVLKQHRGERTFQRYHDMTVTEVLEKVKEHILPLRFLNITSPPRGAGAGAAAGAGRGVAAGANV